MNNAPKVFIALPAYNEAANIEEVIRRWATTLNHAALTHEFVIVNDGSSDATGVLLRRLAVDHPLTLLTHPVNLGLGPTLRDALRIAAGRAADGDLIVTMDADNSHPPELFPEMMARLALDDADVAIASRYRGGARVVGLSSLRRLTSWGARVLFQVVHPVRGVRDYTCGYRVYRAGVIRSAIAELSDAFCAEQSFACMVDVLLTLARRGARFVEVPLVLRYDDKLGASKMRVSRTTWRTLAVMMRHRFGRHACTGKRDGSAN